MEPAIIVPNQTCKECGRRFTGPLVAFCSKQCSRLYYGMAAPLAVGGAHEGMAEICNRNGIVLGIIHGSTLAGQPYPEDLAQALVDAFNAQHVIAGANQ